MFDASLPPGDDHDRVDLCRVAGRRLAQRNSEQCEAEGVEDGEESEKSSDHNRPRNALSRAALATSEASSATAKGTAARISASLQPSGGDPDKVVARRAPPRMNAMMIPATPAPPIPPSKASIAICRRKSRATWRSVAPTPCITSIVAR